MNILLIVTGLGVGGAEKQVCDLSDKFIEKGHQVTIVSLTKPERNLILPNNKEVKVIFLNMRKNVSGFFSAYLKLRQIVKEIAPDVIHSHMYHANIMARFIRLSVKMSKLICTAHNTNEGGRLRMLFYKYTNGLADLNTNVSQEAVDIFIKKGAATRENMIAVANGINTELYCKKLNGEREKLGYCADEFIFLAVGRLTPQKDYPNLLHAFSRVYQVNPRARLVIAGQGELEDDLKKLAEELEISSVVNFLGLRKDIPELMNIADTYVLSSEYEGLPLVLGEAMSSENIIVATDSGGTKEIMGDTGFIVPIKNSNLLAKAMQNSMMLKEDDKIRLGKLARERIIKYYSLNAVADNWIRLYKG